MVHLLYLFLSEQHREPYNWCYANCITSTKIWRQYVCFGQYAKWNVFHTAFSVTRCFTLYDIVQHFCSLLLTQIEKKGQHFKENILSQIFPFFFQLWMKQGIWLTWVKWRATCHIKTQKNRTQRDQVINGTKY